MNTTQIKLIEAAEREFAERGFHGASIRDITRRAKANVAAVNYHFGSKEKLFIEMIRLRVEPINQLRFELLKQALDANKGQPLSVRKLVETIVRPMIEAYLDPNAEGRNPYFLQAVGRGMSEDAKFMVAMRKDIFSKVIETFCKELARSLPKASPELAQKSFAMLGVTLSGLLQKRRGPDASAPNADSVIAYIAGGIEAMVASELDS